MAHGRRQSGLDAHLAVLAPPTANGSTHDAHATAGWETAEAEREKTAAMPWAVKEANLVMNKALAAGLLKLAR